MEGPLADCAYLLRAIIDATTGAATRRHFLAWLSVAIATGGVPALWQGMPAGAKKGKGKGKKGKGKKGKGRKGKKRTSRVPSYNPDAEEQAFLSLINAHRTGLPALALQSRLGAAAEKHAQNMADQNAMFHSNLGSLLKQVGYTGYSLAGENVAYGYTTASQVIAAWKASPTHNANMLTAGFNEIGIGRAFSAGCNCWYWATEFGSR